MDFQRMLQEALDLERQAATEIERLQRIQWGAQGQVELLRQLIALQQQQPAQDAATPTPAEG